MTIKYTLSVLMCGILWMGLHLSATTFSLPTSQTLPSERGKFIKDCPLLGDNSVFCKGYHIRKVVIDPGHGGRDHGCTGHGSIEKHLALQMAKRLGLIIQYEYPEVEVVYTRKKDVFVPLHQRVAIANQAQADLFISIHCNAMPAGAAYIQGSETYVMGIHTSEENLEVAKRENASILLEDDYLDTYGGYDPYSPEGHIFMSMFQNAYLEQSIEFAHHVEQQIAHHARRKSRGVKQAGFVVLRQTTMPSVLIETGYLTNTHDHAFLASENGQQKIAESIFEAFRLYKNQVEDME